MFVQTTKCIVFDDSSIYITIQSRFVCVGVSNGRLPSPNIIDKSLSYLFLAVWLIPIKWLEWLEIPYHFTWLS